MGRPSGRRRDGRRRDGRRHRRDCGRQDQRRGPRRLGEGAYPRNGTSVDEQMTFPVGDGSPPPGGPQSFEELPLVSVVTALTALNEDERKLVDGWSDAINRVVIEAGPAGEPVKDSIPRKSRETWS